MSTPIILPVVNELSKRARRSSSSSGMSTAGAEAKMAALDELARGLQAAEMASPGVLDYLAKEILTGLTGRSSAFVSDVMLAMSEQPNRV